MGFLRSRSYLALLGVLLSACAASVSEVREDVEAPEVVSSSWQEARADPTCVVPLCDGERCAIWRCQDVAEVEAPRVVLAQAAVPQAPGPLLRTPLVEPPLHHRWWGHPRHQCLISPREPFEKHHIFPQQLARWFEIKGIAIHAFTIRVPRSFHQWLHSGGPEGGQWNEAWRRFQKKNPDPPPEEIWRFAGELMMRFGVNGPLVPYYCD